MHAFKRRRIFQACGCLALAALASAFLLLGLAAWTPAPVIGWLGFCAAVLLYALLIPILRETFTPGPILTISAEGLYYRPLSRTPIPWTEIRAITLLRAPQRYGGKPSERVMFDVRDPLSVQNRGGFGGAMMGLHGAMLGGGYRIDAVQARAEDIIAAIRIYWRSDIPTITFPAGQTPNRTTAPGE